MEQIQTKQHSRLLHKTQEPGLYHVILHNDDVTTVDFVIEILETIFQKEHNEAVALTMKVDREGSAIAGTYYKDIAESKKDKAMREARNNGFPLLLTVEKAQ